MILSEQIGIQQTLQDCCKLRICLQLKQQLYRIQTRLLCRFGTQRLLHTPQVRLCIEASFKALGIHFPVFIQNVSVDLSDHIRLRVTRIALGCFDVALVQL